ncbi:MAG: hypothetical protein ACRCX2_12515 [Paraclostridium sp.]
MGLLTDNGFTTDIKTRTNNIQSRAYNVWYNMIRRCYDKKSVSYKTYGAKGIRVCEEWRLYSNFKRWYDENYIEGYEIDKDFSLKGYYGPDSCVFIKKSDNIREAMSRRDNLYLKNKTGQNHHSHKPMCHYETKSSRRHEFKRNCNTNGWDFNDFKEVYSGIKTSRHTKLFYYFYNK